MPWRHARVVVVMLALLLALSAPAAAVPWNSTPRTVQDFFALVNSRLPGAVPAQYATEPAPTGPSQPPPAAPAVPAPQPPAGTVLVPMPTGGYIIRKLPPSLPPVGSFPELPAGMTAEEAKMVQSINEARADAGVHPLVVNVELVRVARYKSQDMIDHNYVGHWSPTYGVLRDLMRLAGITRYRWAGENVAASRSPEQAFINLMNSPGHQRAILSPTYSQVGVGIVKGGRWGWMVTQLFYAP